MAGKSQPSTNSTPFSTVLQTFISQLQTGLGATVPVFATAIPESELHTYEAQDGVLVHISTPMPFPRCGAGRYGRRVFRFLTCVVLTQSLSDQAGQDLNAVIAHTLREEAIENAVDEILPGCILLDWIDGGEDIVRQIQTDPGMLKSALRFRCEYTSPETVTIGTT